MFSFEMFSCRKSLFAGSKPLVFFSSAFPPSPFLQYLITSFFKCFEATSVEKEQLSQGQQNGWHFSPGSDQKGKPSLTIFLGTARGDAMGTRLEMILWEQLEVIPEVRISPPPWRLCKPTALVPSPGTRTSSETPARRKSPWVSAQLIRRL